MMLAEFPVVDEVRYEGFGEKGLAPRPAYYLVGHFALGQEVYLDDFDVRVRVEAFAGEGRWLAYRLDDLDGVRP